MSIQPGDRIPDAILQCIRDGVQKVDTASLFKGNKLVLFAVPGAFTPTCSERHLPGFVEHFGSFHDKGIGVACMAVNDPFVMQAWGESQHVPEGLQMLSDGNGEFTRKLGLEMDAGTLVATGYAADELAEASTELDLLVLGSRSYGPVRRVILGGTSVKVMRSSACPVVVVPKSSQ